MAGLLGAALAFAGILLVAGGALYVLTLLVVGLVVGALGRVAVSRPDPKSVGTTLLLAVGGSFLGGMGGWFLFHRPGGYVLSGAGAIFLVWLTRTTPGLRPGAGGPPAPRRRPP